MFEPLIPFIDDRITKHHELYSGQCKGENWEEILCWALKRAGYGSDWKPDYNHGIGVDQTTDSGIRISNKSGKVEKDYVVISGSRLTKHKTIDDKLNFLSEKTHDYIFCLGTEKDEWNKGIKRYYFIVIDSDKLKYHEQHWKETYGEKGRYKGKVNGWKCLCEIFSAKIVKSMSDQLWTTIKLDHCEEIHEITIGRLSENSTNT
jgi:hypothetical protein